MSPKFKTPYSHDEPAKFMFSCKEPSMTEQQFEYETNINNIVKGCVQSSLPANTSEALYGLTVTGKEFETALNTQAEVVNYFEQLPSRAKDYFQYNPKNLLEFIQDESNYEKAYDLGLIDKTAFYARKDAFLAKQAQLNQQTPSEVTPDPLEVIPN